MALITSDFVSFRQMAGKKKCVQCTHAHMLTHARITHLCIFPCPCDPSRRFVSVARLVTAAGTLLALAAQFQRQDRPRRQKHREEPRQAAAAGPQIIQVRVPPVLLRVCLSLLCVYLSLLSLSCSLLLCLLSVCPLYCCLLLPAACLCNPRGARLSYPALLLVRCPPPHRFRPHSSGARVNTAVNMAVQTAVGWTLLGLRIHRWRVHR